MSQKLTQVWRLQTTTDGGKIADLCLERNSACPLMVMFGRLIAPTVYPLWIIAPEAASAVCFSSIRHMRLPSMERKIRRRRSSALIAVLGVIITCKCAIQDMSPIYINEALRDITVFKQTLMKMRDYYGLQEFSLKQIDQYLWQYGKEKFLKPYGRKKVPVVEYL